VVVLVSDLMFASRIREAARGGALAVRTLRRPQELLEACVADPPSLVLVDLDDERLQPLDALRLLREDAALQALPVIGFVSHVDGARALAAQAAGCSRVLARSAFVAELPRLLARG
jgi:CheY-like chemotaxis protein